MNHKFSIHASTLPSILQNLEWKSLWLSRMKILLLQPDYVFCHMKPKYCGKVWTYAHKDWQIPQIPINGDKSAILASIPRGVGLILPSVHVRITWGACLEMHLTRPKLTLISLGFRGRPVSDVCNRFPRIPDASTSWELEIQKSWSSWEQAVNILYWWIQAFSFKYYILF